MLSDMSSTSFDTRLPVAGRTVPASVARIRYALLAALVVVALGAVAFGVRPASWAELTRAIDHGRVTEVTVLNALEPGQTGEVSPEIRWHDGFMPRTTSVRQVRPGTLGETGSSIWTSEDRPLHQVTGDLAPALNEYAAAPVKITTAQPVSTQFYIRDWIVPGWVTVLALAAWAFTISLVITAPEPLLATRWAWFWAIMSPLGVVAMPLFLLFGIPRTGAIERPYSRAGRLTGGWAFILFCILLVPLGQALV